MVAARSVESEPMARNDQPSAMRTAAARHHGKAAGMLVGDGAAAAVRIAEGWSFLAIGSDSTLLAATIRTQLDRARTTS